MTAQRWSEYDQVWITSESSLDVDHMVPLAEAWDSGAASWTAGRREAYANDQGAPNSLIAVSGSSNRSKADKDPADWLPVKADQCKYAADWVADKLRWKLTADPAERDALSRLAEDCPGTAVSYEQVPLPAGLGVAPGLDGPGLGRQLGGRGRDRAAMGIHGVDQACRLGCGLLGGGFRPCGRLPIPAGRRGESGRVGGLGIRWPGPRCGWRWCRWGAGPGWGRACRGRGGTW
ncbi:HNH endonuclease family protein [Streptomyces sp. NPDC086989]|uniref:HNH endonuclease family protein n=1 Tax=Streptomyces sp. NPDC086989 TaxID=3365764 RepID=UPI003824843A